MRRIIYRSVLPLRKGRLAGEEGMTLLEVVVSLVILAVGLLAVAGMQTISTRVDANAFKFTTAATFADGGIVQLANLSYTDPKLNPGGPNVDPACPPPVQGVVYTCQYSVVDNTPIAGVKTITYTVSWDNGAHSVSLVDSVGNELL